MTEHLPRCDLDDCRCESRRKWLILWIGLAIFAAELIGGYFSRSLSLLSDSGHVFVDTLAVAMAIWVDWRVSNDHDIEDRWRIRGARAQGALLVAIAIWIAAAAKQRMAHQESIVSIPMIIIAIIGMVANYFQHRILEGGEKNITQRGLDIHILSDLGQSMAVAIGGVLIAITGVLAIDLVVSGILAVVMFVYGFLLTFFPKILNHQHH